MKSALSKVISGAVCIAFAVSSASVLENIVADAVNIENPVTVNATAMLENGLEYEVYEEYVEITGCDTSAEGEIIIPNTIEGLPVTEIRHSAFEKCDLMTSVTIPDSVTYIDLGTFSDCPALAAIHVNTKNQNYMDVDGVLFSKDQTELEYYPAGKSDQSYSIPDGVVRIGMHAFVGCPSLISVTIPNGVKHIDNGVFVDCFSLESITIPESAETIESVAFISCPALKAIHVNTENQIYTDIDGVLFSKEFETLGLQTYPNGKLDQSYSIPNGVTNIMYYAFAGCPNLTSVTIPDSVTSIEGCAFSGCSALKSVTIPDSVTSIEYRAFESCSALESITISDNVTSIELYAFENCSALESVTIPNNITSIKGGAFSGCSVLKSATIQNPDCEIYDADSTISDTAVIYGYPGSTAQAYAEKYNRKFVALEENQPVETDTYDVGDLDGNGSVNAMDASIILQYAAATGSGNFTGTMREYLKENGYRS